MGVQEEGAGGSQPQQEQQQLQLKAHVQKEGAGQEPQHATVHRVLWGGVGLSRGGAYATCQGGRISQGSCPTPPRAQVLSGDKEYHTHKHTPNVFYIHPNSQDGMFFN